MARGLCLTDRDYNCLINSNVMIRETRTMAEENYLLLRFLL